jgi:hypothetical protein
MSGVDVPPSVRAYYRNSVEDSYIQQIDAEEVRATEDAYVQTLYNTKAFTYLNNYTDTVSIDQYVNALSIPMDIPPGSSFCSNKAAFLTTAAWIDCVVTFVTHCRYPQSSCPIQFIEQKNNMPAIVYIKNARKQGNTAEPYWEYCGSVLEHKCRNYNHFFLKYEPVPYDEFDQFLDKVVILFHEKLHEYDPELYTKKPETEIVLLTSYEKYEVLVKLSKRCAINPWLSYPTVDTLGKSMVVYTTIT